MVGTFNHIKIVLDDDHAFPLVYQASQHLKQAGNICGVQPCGRFVQNIECLTGWALRELGGKLNALGFPTGEGGCRLTQLDIAQPHILNGLDFVVDCRDVFKKCHGFVHRHIQHLGNIFATIGNLQGFAVVAFTLADLTRGVHVR